MLCLLPLVKLELDPISALAVVRLMAVSQRANVVSEVQSYIAQWNGEPAAKRLKSSALSVAAAEHKAIVTHAANMLEVELDDRELFFSTALSFVRCIDGLIWKCIQEVGAMVAKVGAMILEDSSPLSTQLLDDMMEMTKNLQMQLKSYDSAESIAAVIQKVEAHVANDGSSVQRLPIHDMARIGIRELDLIVGAVRLTSVVHGGDGHVTFNEVRSTTDFANRLQQQLPSMLPSSSSLTKYSVSVAFLRDLFATMAAAGPAPSAVAGPAPSHLNIDHPLMIARSGASAIKHHTEDAYGCAVDIVQRVLELTEATYQSAFTSIFDEARLRPLRLEILFVLLRGGSVSSAERPISPLSCCSKWMKTVTYMWYVLLTRVWVR